MVHKINNIDSTIHKTRNENKSTYIVYVYIYIYNIYNCLLKKNYKILIKMNSHEITDHHTSCTLLFSPLPIIENGFGEKGLMQAGHVTMCCFHWLINKETAWPDRSEHRQVEQTEQNAGKKRSGSVAMKPAARSDMLNLSW